MPPWTSPTSKAICPPGRTTRNNSLNTSVMAFCQSVSLVGIVSFTDLASIPRNQQRSQLSAPYCTTLRNGGDVTTSSMEFDAICGVELAGLVNSSDLGRTRSSDSLTEKVRSLSNCRDFFKMIPTTARRGGTCLRCSFILRWAFAETAWLGGRVYTEKKPFECPVRRLRATNAIQSSTGSNTSWARRRFCRYFLIEEILRRVSG